MKLGFIILAHQNLQRTAQLVRFLAENDCPVSLHIDLNAAPEEIEDLFRNLNDVENVVFPKRVKCSWGQFSIVKATLNAAEELLAHHPDVTNVFLSSGSCLPARPIKQLKAFLDRNIGTDFIESFSVHDESWVKKGLSKERFTLFFPLSWRRHRFAFDRLVDIQRLFRIRRKIPKHIRPHIGSQWWCLTSTTLRKVIDDPNRFQNDKFFSKSWIPDESYFQTIVLNHSKRIKAQSLTFSAFDSQGKPFQFYDDHLDKLPQTAAFFIRKVWPGANNLYRELLSNNRKNLPLSEANAEAFMKWFTDTNDIRNFGNEGRFMQGRFPWDSSERSGVSDRGFGVFTGLGLVFSDFPEWAKQENDLNVFNNIFARKQFTFHKKIALEMGNLTASAKIRKSNPKGFLSSFIWSQRDKSNISILFDVMDDQAIMKDLTRDKNAHFIIIREAWLLSIANSGMNSKGKIMQARVLQSREEKFIKLLKKNKPASFKVFSLSEALKSPGKILQSTVQTICPDEDTKPIAIPDMNDTSGLDDLVRKLEKNDILLDYKPAKKRKNTSIDSEKVINRPYVVK